METRGSADSTQLVIRRATGDDLAAIVALLADDALGATRESPEDLGRYAAAFAAIDADPSQLLVVGESGGRLIATLQLSLIPGLARRGAVRAQLEAVRVATSARGRGVGRVMIQWAIAEAERRGCELVQLTSDKRRPDAHRFYARLGFVATHEGFKRPVR